MNRKESSLPPRTKKKIWAAIETAISQNPNPDDREPSDVIRSTFKGDENAYLRTMASSYGIRLPNRRTSRVHHTR